MSFKKELILLVVIIVLANILLYKMYTPGIYSSHDGEVHIARMAQFGQALYEGNFPVRFIRNWNFGYGYPAFIFIYQTPYLISSSLYLIIKNFEVIFKVMMISSLFLSGITFFYFAKKLVSPTAAFVGSIFYISAPYRFADIYERGALAESLFFIFAPLLFLSVFGIYKNQKTGFVAAALIFFVAITLHALTLLIFLLPIFIFSTFVFRRKLSLYLVLFSSFIFSLGLSAFNWIPMIFEQKYVNLDRTYFDLFKGHFLTIYQLLRIPPFATIGTGIQFGTAQLAVVLLSLIAKKHKLVIFFLASTIIGAFFTLGISQPVWEITRPIQTLLFPWRFLAFTTFTTAILSAYLFEKFSPKKFRAHILIVFLIVAIVPSRHFLKGQNWQTFDENYYINYQDPKKLDNYFLPKGLNLDMSQIQLPQVSTISGKLQVTNDSFKNSEIFLNLEVLEKSLVQFHTIYFPGWQLDIDGQKSEIIKDYLNLEGLIIARVPEGIHYLNLKFEETPLRRFANITTLTSFLVLPLILIFKKKKHFCNFSH